MKLKLITFSLVSCLIVVPNCKAQTKGSENKNKPNLLVIVTDEHNFRTLGVYKKLYLEKGLKYQANPWGEVKGFSTPNLDRIGNEGAVFTSMYASSPSCTPSRSSMFTGNYPQTNGTPKNGLGLNENCQTIAKVLDKVGYKTGYAGKWHLEKGDPRPSWAPKSSFHGFENNSYMFNSGHWKQLGFEADGITPKVAVVNGLKAATTANEKTYTTDWLADRAVDFIEKNKKESFAYVLSFPDPHTPDIVRAPYQDMYSEKDIQLPETFSLTALRDDTYPFWIRTKQRLPKNSDIGKLKKAYAAYHGSVKCIDDNIGKILKKLEEEGILDNTIIVFSSDHGDMLGEYGHKDKGVPYEGSARIPFVIRYPKAIKAGTIVNKAANTTDWMDTFLSLMKVDSKVFDSNTTEGRNIASVFTKNSDDVEDITFVRYQTWASAMTDRYKLVFDTSATKPWLIDLELDPLEGTNYIDSKDHKAIVKMLAKRLLEYGVKSKDDIVLHNKNKPLIEAIIKS